ncbi:hypothetical protein EAH81_04460 [Flavobacterium pectinovorum]|uniref:Uncharacterized protein n=1 Tax=Flavobacterium pectinovorum TaxID=29533 RepID=A0A502F4M1_9FLAO|nr:hypothetical protein EAH81_04460 [Flavobacterium pectinovorum]
MECKYEDFIIHFIGLIGIIFFWMVMYKLCEKLKYFSEDDLFFNSKTLSFYCLCVPITIVYIIALILEFIELQ